MSQSGQKGQRNSLFGDSKNMSNRDEARLTIRLQQPIEGYPSEAFLLGVGIDGTLIPKHSLTSTTKWYRSRAFRACANTRCPYYGNNAGEPPSGNGSPNITPPPDMVLRCEEMQRLSYPEALTYFCSPSCLAMFWPNRPKDTAKQAATDESKEESLWGLQEPMPKDTTIPGRETAWDLVSEHLVYTPSADDVWHKLRVEVEAKFPDGRILSQTAYSRCVLPKPPSQPRRRYSVRHLQQHSATEAMPVFPELAASHPLAKNGDQAAEDPAARHSIRLFSYNILAEIFAGQSAYPYADQWELAWAFRRRNILQEILQADADIICLQEAQADSFESYFHPELTKRGYDAVYKQKTREAMGTAGRVDGCALFFKRSRFRAVEKYVIEFNDAAVDMARKEPPDTSGMVERGLKRLMRDNVAQVVVLEVLASKTGEPLVSPAHLCVANTHLFWDPEYADVKLWQVHMLSQELERLTSPRQLPLVLCGDFNSEPGSAVHRLLSLNALLGQAGVELPSHRLPNDPCGILRTRGRLRHSLFLRSAYTEAWGREPEFTNYTGNFKGCLDYVWVTSNLINVTAALGLPSAKELTAYTGKPLPNAQYPSDHLSLIVDIRLKSLDVPCVLRGGPGYPAPPPTDVSDMLSTSDEEFAPPKHEGRGTPTRRGSLGRSVSSPGYSDGYASTSLSPARSPAGPHALHAYGGLSGLGSPAASSAAAYGATATGGARGNGGGGPIGDGGVALSRGGRGRPRPRGGGKRGARVGKQLFPSPAKRNGSWAGGGDHDAYDDDGSGRRGRGNQGRKGSISSVGSGGSHGDWSDFGHRSHSSGQLSMAARH